MSEDSPATSSMTSSTWPDLSTVSDPTASTHAKLAHLNKVKNSLIGHTERKLKLLRSGTILVLVQLVVEPDTTISKKDSLALALQACAILGAISLPTPEAAHILLSAKAHQAIVTAFLSVRTRPSPISPTPTPESRFVEALLRSLKILYTDLIKVVGPRAWGTDVIGASVSPEERRDVGTSWEHPAGKGKMKEADADVSEVRLLSDLRSLADEALEEIFGTREVAASSSASEKSLSIITKVVPSRILDNLLALLINLSYPEASTNYPNRLRLAEHICSFLAGTVRLPEQRRIVLADAESTTQVTAALLRLIEHGNGKVQESALEAFSALTRDHRFLGGLLPRTNGEEEGFPKLETITELTQSASPSLRLAATTCQAILFKTLQVSLSTPARAIPSAEPLVSVLLGLMTDGGLLRAQAAFTFAYLIADSDALQGIAIRQKCLDVLRDVLEQPSCIDQPYATPFSIEEAARTREGALLSIACLSAMCEPYRHQILSANLLPTVVASLSHPSTAVKAAACHVIRGLARSVNVLRMTLIDASAARPIYELLDDGQDLIVKVVAAAAVSNLVLEFSPMRQPLIELGSIGKLCHLAHSEDYILRLNALYALKNATYQSNASFKRDVAEKLGWGFLGDLVGSSNNDISLQALGIIRNFSCPYNEDEVTGKGFGSAASDHAEDLPLTGLHEIGEDRLLGLLEDCLGSKLDSVVLQAVYVIVNLATTSESAKLAIMAQSQFVRKIMLHLGHSDDRVRVAAVWVFINLCHHERSNGPRSRRPHEIVARLKAMGLEVRLKQMNGDISLDVRERVRDALGALGHGTY